MSRVLRVHALYDELGRCRAEQIFFRICRMNTAARLYDDVHVSTICQQPFSSTALGGDSL